MSDAAKKIGRDNSEAKPLWTGTEVAEILGGQWQPPSFSSPIYDVAYEISDCRPGTLAIVVDGPSWQGDWKDTEDQIGEIAGAKASAAVVRKQLLSENAASIPSPVVEFPLPVLAVDNTFDALQSLARDARSRFCGKVAAITGVVGKTSTRTILSEILGRQAPTASSIANRNFGPTLWLDLCRARRDAAFGIYELGMLGPGSIGPKSQLVQPDVAVITALGPAHLQHHPDLNSVIETKAGILDGLHPEGTFVAPRDTPWFDYLVARAPAQKTQTILSFGEDVRADVRLLSAKYSSSGSEFSVWVAGHAVQCVTAVPGKHIVQNMLAALATAHALGADIDQAAADLSKWRPPSGRTRVESIDLAEGQLKLVDDSFNANPISVRASLELLAMMEPGPGGRRLAVLADMLELGPWSRELHETLASPLIQSKVVKVFTIGDHVQALRTVLPPEILGPHADSLSQLTFALDAALRPGDVLLVKGSHATKVSDIGPWLRSRAKYSALLLDARSRSVVYEFAADAPRFPASLAKLMTLYLVFTALKAERLALDEEIVVSALAGSRVKRSSTIGCAPNDRLSVEEAIRGLIVPSANDAALTIAEHISGNEATFTELMNSTANAIGLSRSRFANASGLHNPEGHTTARDIATLALAIRDEFPEYLPYFAETSFEFRGQAFTATNRLLGTYGVTGMKTGHTLAAGYHLVASAERGAHQLISVVMGADSEESRDDKSKQLLELGFLRRKSAD